ncbi:MAG: hypothetical protein ABIJ58_00380 [Nanoarchaeota archaeon]
MALKNIVIGIAIMILTISVVVQGVALIYERPNYDDYCGEFKINQIIENQEQCETTGGQWEPQDIRCVTEPCPQGYCNRDFTCSKDYDVANGVYSRNIFLIALPVGIAVIAVGALIFGLEAVGAGLMAGGVGVILWGVTGFWSFADDWLKFVLSLIGLVIVIWLAFRMNSLTYKKKRR